MAGEEVNIIVNADISPATQKFAQIKRAITGLASDAENIKQIKVELKAVGVNQTAAQIRDALKDIEKEAKNALTRDYAKTAVDQAIAGEKKAQDIRNQVAKDGAQFRSDQNKLVEDRATQARQEELKSFRKDITDRNNSRIAGEKEYLATVRKNTEYLSQLRANSRAKEDAELSKQAERAYRHSIGLDEGLPRLRYALYDVASGAQQISQAMLGITTSVVSMAASYETAFTSVERTTGATVTQLDVLKTGLLGLAREIPLTFQDITGIASLGAQMGISSDALEKFTMNVAQFAAVTNVSIESAAQSFGALGELLNVSAEEYNNLGSAIAYAGVKSNATESEILAVSTAIAGVASTANLTPQYVLGLSTALASLRVPAEQSRGALTRVFQEINRAATSGAGISQFAKVIGTTTEEAKKLASTDMGTFFNKFIAGLSKMNAQELTASLDSLSLADIRVTNTLSRLAENTNVVSDSMNNVDEAYQSGTFLAEAYGSRVDDIAAKFQILTNIATELGAIMGATLFGPLNLVLDALTWLGKAFSDIAKNPVGQVLLTVAAVVTTVVGAVAGLASIVALSVAGFLAARTAFVGLAQAGIGINSTLITTAASFFRVNMGAVAATESIVAYTGATRAATVASNALSKAGPIMMAVTVALTAIAAGWDLVAKANKSAEERAREYYGSNSSIIDAAKQDTAELAAGIQSTSDIWRTIDIEPIKLTDGEKEAERLKTAAEAAVSMVGPVDDLANSQNGLEGSINGATKALNAQELALGENAKAAALKIIQDKILSDAENPLVKIFADPALSGALQNAGVNISQYTQAILANDKEQIASIEAAMQARLEQLAVEREAAIASGDTKKIDAINAEIEALYNASGELETFKQQTIGLVPAAEAMANALDAVNVAVDESKISTIFDGIEDKAKASNEFVDSLEALTAGLEQNGQSFDLMTSGGINNINNLNTAINSAISAAESLGIGAAGTIGQVFATLEAQGIATGQLLQQVSQMGGVQAQAAAAVSAAQADSYAGLTSAYNAMKKGATGAGNAASAAAKKVYTLLDYANDLSSVWDRAFDIRFSSSKALDNITKSWRSMAEAAADARQEIQDINQAINELNADVQSLTADKALQQYFLSVAEAYGDALRASEIRAEIGQIDAELAKKTGELASKNAALQKAQAKTNKTLVGNSDAAIENRAEIIGLIGDYQDYIKTLAASGASQDQLRAATNQARNDFMMQATQLGYNSTELGVYAAAFDDVTVAINNVPRNITVTANTNPALQALNELNAKTAAATAPRTMSVGVSADYGAIAKFARGAAILAEINDLTSRQSNFARDNPRNTWGINWYTWKIAPLRDALNSGNFASGGYTGAGGKYDVAGIVHRGEYVIPKEQVNQSTGMPRFMEQPRSFAQGGYTGPVSGGSSSSVMMVELSPYDRKLLASAGNVQLRLDGRVVAEATNANNFVSAQRGSN